MVEKKEKPKESSKKNKEKDVVMTKGSNPLNLREHTDEIVRSGNELSRINDRLKEDAEKQVRKLDETIKGLNELASIIKRQLPRLNPLPHLLRSTHPS